MSTISSQNAKGLDPMRLKRVVEFMTENLSEDISLSDLAEVSCLSMFHFARAFKLSTGSSPMLHLSQMRLSKAKHHLEHSSMSIDNIAETVGYSSGANFERAFRKLCGISPSIYRQRIRN